jgi:hypothetical protein
MRKRNLLSVHKLRNETGNFKIAGIKPEMHWQIRGITFFKKVLNAPHR